MMAGRLPQRVRGEGWEVWLDDRGILRTRDSRAMDAATAQVRLLAMDRFIARREVRGVLVDDTDPATGDAPDAYGAYAAWMSSHPGLKVALVTRHMATIGQALGARAAAGSDLAVFSNVEAAEQWLLGESPEARRARAD